MMICGGILITIITVKIIIGVRIPKISYVPIDINIVSVLPVKRGLRYFISTSVAVVIAGITTA